MLSKNLKVNPSQGSGPHGPLFSPHLPSRTFLKLVEDAFGELDSSSMLTATCLPLSSTVAGAVVSRMGCLAKLALSVHLTSADDGCWLMGALGYSWLSTLCTHG